MYFASRLQAGRMLARQMAKKYRHSNSTVVALSDGGVMVGAQIANELHCLLSLMVSAEITLPREPLAVAGITPSGEVAYNPDLSASELTELTSENRNYIEQQKLEQMHVMNELLGKQGVIDKKLLKGRNIILVSDGIKSSFLLDLAAEFLKPIAIQKLIVATPFASVPAVDKMHVMADEIYCLNVIADYMDTDHYYDKQDVPSHETVVKTINQVMLNWK